MRRHLAPHLVATVAFIPIIGPCFFSRDWARTATYFEGAGMSQPLTEGT